MAEAYPGSDSSSVSSSDNEENWLNKPGDEGEEEEQENVSVVSLFDDSVFPDAVSMVACCKMKHGFDFIAVRDRLGLDFHGCVKLVNLVRKSVKKGVPLPLEISSADLADDQLLIPEMEDDAFIFCLDDLPASASSEDPVAPKGSALGTPPSRNPPVDELLMKNARLQEELEQLTKQFTSYRLAVEKTLDKRWGVDEEEAKGEASKPDAAASATPEKKQRDESTYYFESYAHNDIHETMIKDAVRTDAYRDFIYNNKDLFRGKVVLDIGCGTGILSMFCARAGAARVLAVDNSAILDKARENVFRNKLDDIITCIKGRIEDVTLPVPKVDIIVSEWMGYCLLYEAMLPSVFFARDKYLKPDGLLVPSHASMWIAPAADAEYVNDAITWWSDVYGFDMDAMRREIYTDARMTVMPGEAVCGTSSAFRMLDLHTAKVEDLVFEDPWETTLKPTSASGENLDGFLVWFDCFFAESRNEVVDKSLSAKAWIAAGGQGSQRVAFTTGPFDTATHWRQGLYMINNLKAKPIKVAEGTKLTGTIRYAIPDDHARGLNITLTWASEDVDKQSQTWLLY